MNAAKLNALQMRFAAPACPTCGKQAEGTLETVYGVAVLQFDEEGRAEYAGGTEMDWHSQQTVDGPGGVTLECPEGHRWESAVEWGPT